MSDWTVVLSSEDAKRVVLYNTRDKQLAVKNATSPSASVVGLPQSEDFGTCSMCRRPFASPYMYRSYFRLLAEAYEANSVDSDSSGKGSAGRTSKRIPKAALNTGYYEQFFVDLGRVGRGGGGAVFACEHTLNGAILGRYAVKKVPVGDDTDWLSRLLHEVHMLESMRHENVIEYKHAWLETWQPSPFAPCIPHLFILMEYAERGNLEDLLEEEHDLDCLPLFRQIALGLAHLHGRGILHRDLKPSNILLKTSPRDASLIPMISDFGEASQVQRRTRDSIDRSGATGTIEYMAPELLATDAGGRFTCQHSVGSDIWSLGMIFFTCIYRRLPYSNVDDYDALHEQIAQMRSVDLPREPEVDSPLKGLIKAMLSVDPDQRPPIKTVIDVLSTVQPAGRAPRARMLPPSFTPVSFSQSRGEGSPPGPQRTGRAGRAWRALHFSPLLWLLVSYCQCYPVGISVFAVAIDCVFFIVTFCLQSIPATLVLGLMHAVLHMHIINKVCAI